MSAQLQAKQDTEQIDSLILTLIIPGTCGMGCEFCIIDHLEEEQGKHILTPDDYGRFISEIHAVHFVAAVCIQGREPTNPQSMPYTERILACAHECSRPSSFVTNGLWLAQHAEQLVATPPGKIAVSIDSGLPEEHNRIRKNPRAFARAVEGIRAVQNVLPETGLNVTSVYQPNGRHFLESMPQLLKELGIQGWSINVQITPGSESFGGPTQADEQCFRDLVSLYRLACDHGLSCFV